MNEPARKLKGRIQSAQQWLNQAEEHFGRNAAARGEMDLLLAEAELRSTRETLRSHRRWFAIAWAQQGTAFVLAAMMAVAGAGGAWWWWRDQTPLPAPAPAVTVAVPLAPPEPVRNISAVASPKPAPAPAVEATPSAQEVNSADKPASREPTISPNEMKRLIQAAGQSLRGRTKP